MSRGLRSILAGIGFPVLGVLATGWASRASDPAGPHSTSAVPTPLLTSAPVALLDSALDVIIDGNPFRLDHAPALVAFGQPPAVAPVAPPAPSRPQLPILTALLGGPPWRAVLENVPGFEQSLVVTAGMWAGPFAVIQVSAAGIRLSAGDTTWNLRLRRL